MPSTDDSYKSLYVLRKQANQGIIISISFDNQILFTVFILKKGGENSLLEERNSRSKRHQPDKFDYYEKNNLVFGSST